MDTEARARTLLDALERSDVATVEALLGPARVASLRDHHQWTVADYLVNDWHPSIDMYAGSPRQVVGMERVRQSRLPPESWPVRFTLEGPNGQAFFSVVRFHEDGVGSFGVNGDVPNGIATIYVHCPADRRPELAAFYAHVLQQPVNRRGTAVVTGRLPRLAIARAQAGELMPRWPDGDRPQQMHLDFHVPDVHAAAERVTERGATLLQRRGSHHTYADPVGHPFCLYPADVDRPAIGRLVIDGPDPRALAAFYAELLDMPETREDTAEGTVIAASDRGRPMLAFQRTTSAPPRWGDPRHPQQVHVDLSFDDGAAAKERAEQLGAPRLAPLGGSCPVYADPAGHPFCLCNTD